MDLKQRKLFKNLSAENKNRLPGFNDGTIQGIEQLRSLRGIPIESQYAEQAQTQNQADFDAWKTQADQSFSQSVYSNNFGNDNRQKGPTQADSAASGAGPWFAIGSWLGGGMLEGINSYQSKNELLNNAGRSNNSYYGVNYNEINDINGSKVMDDLNRNKYTSLLTNPGRFFGSWIGESSQKNAIREAEKIRDSINPFNKSIAGTQGLQQMVASDRELKFRNQFPTYAANGKLPKFDNGGVYTPWGVVDGIKPNARISNGETIVVPGDPTSGYVVPGKPNNKDTKLAYLPEESFVAPNKKGISKYLQETGDLDGAMTMTKLHHNGYKNGRLPRFDEGGFPNAIVSGIGSLASLAQYLDVARQDVHMPNVYHNPVDTQALRNMASARYNMYPVYNNTLKLLSNSNRAADFSGGLSVGQRQASKALNAANAFATLADTAQKYQQANLGLFNTYNQAKLNSTAADAQALYNADVYRDTTFAKGHGQKLQGKQMGLYNIINQLQNYYANEFKRRQFNETLGLYRNEHKLNLARLQAEIDNMKNDHSDADIYAAVRSASPTYFTTNSAPSMTQNSYLTNPNKFYGRSYGLSVPSILTNKPWYLY